MSVEIRSVGDDDVLPVVRTAFGDQGDVVAHLWEELVPGPHLRGSIVAYDDAVVGHVGLSRAWVDARRELVDVWVLSPLSVRPDRQGEGIGTQLVAAALDAARAGGAPLLVLEGSPVYYGARGFEPASAHGLLPATDRTPEPAFQVARFAQEDWMTGRLVYPEVWWTHDLAGLRDPLLAEVERNLP